MTIVYLAVDRLGCDPAGFVQIEVNVEDESHDQQRFEYESGWRTFNDLGDLLLDCDGDPLQAADRQRFWSIACRLDKATDVAEFVQQADDLSPSWQEYPVKARRFFEDWSASSASASASSAQLCEHWVMSMTEHAGSERVRSLAPTPIIPIWATRHQLAEVAASKADPYTCFGKLQTLDRRVKVTFGWYFFMLHGNRVSSEAGERVLRDAEAGLIVLPERDHRVLKGWQTEPYVC